MNAPPDFPAANNKALHQPYSAAGFTLPHGQSLGDHQASSAVGTQTTESQATNDAHSGIALGLNHPPTNRRAVAKATSSAGFNFTSSQNPSGDTAHSACAAGDQTSTSGQG